MNDFKSDEFLDFKFLRSSPSQKEYIKLHREKFLQIYPKLDNIEFLEELFELEGQTVYIVQPQEPVEIESVGITRTYSYEIASIKTVQNTFISKCLNVVSPRDNKVDLSFVNEIESCDGRDFYLIGSSPKSDFFTPVPLFDLPVISRRYITMIEMFASEADANTYAQLVTDYLRKYSSAISAISRYVSF